MTSISAKNSSDPVELPYHTQFEFPPTTSVDTAITLALARVLGQEPDEMDFKLFDYIDPDAIESLFDHSVVQGTSHWAVGFTVEDLVVVIRSDGQITIK